MSKLLIVVGASSLVIGAWVIIQYNRLIALRNSFRNEWAQIDVQLKRRHDLVPNLVETASAYMKHERETLEEVVKARQLAVNADQDNQLTPADMKSVLKAETALNSSLGRLFALAESYPDLKANQNMIQLQNELNSTESQIANARQRYNQAVTAYNTARESVPTNLVARSFGFKEAILFEIELAEQREVPQVSFG